MADASAAKLRVVGDDALARAGLRALLEGAGLTVDAEQTLPEATGGTSPFEATVVELAPGEPFETVHSLAQQGPVLAVLWSEDQARETLSAGAGGVLARRGLRDRLAAALAAVADGLVVIDPALAEAVLRPAAGPPLVEPLTPRESEVVSLLAEGLGNRAIAVRLGISEHTVKFHVNAILGKLGAQSRTEAVAIAARLGLIVL